MRRRLGTEDCLQLVAQLQQDRVKVHSLLFFLWHRGWLLAPAPFQSFRAVAITWALFVGLFMALLDLPIGSSLVVAMLALIWSLSAIGYWERRARLSRPLGNIACLAAVIAASGGWLLLHEHLQWPLHRHFLNWSELVLDVVLPMAVTFGASLALMRISDTHHRRQSSQRDLPAWPVYVDQALVARVF